MAPNFKFIPEEMLEMIPQFDGNFTFLDLFIKKVEFVIEGYRGVDNPDQDEYVFMAVTTRLTGMAVELVGSRTDLKTWDDLKTFLSDHFSDPRSEECIRMELENLRMNANETFYDFCNRIKHVQSTLMAKVKKTDGDDAGMIKAKTEIYDKLSLNTFLYNLPENIVWMVRAKSCKTLEEALAVVMEEVNFQVQYNSKRNSRAQSYPIFKPQPSGLAFGAGAATVAVNPGPTQGSSSLPYSRGNGQGQSSLFRPNQASNPADAKQSIFGAVAPTQHKGPIFPEPKPAPKHE